MIPLLLVCVLLVTAVCFSTQAAEIDHLAVGKQVAADAAAMTFPTDGSPHPAKCPACKTDATWQPLTEAMLSSTVNLTAGHYYLAGKGTSMINAPSTAGMVACLHLNGKEIANANGQAFYGGSGTLNIMGAGQVKGGGTTENAGAAVQINAANSNGAINLYGGTYSKLDSSSATSILMIHNNGGAISLYSGATVQGSGSVNGVNIGNTNRRNSLLNIYGGTIDVSNSTGYGIHVNGTTATAARPAVITMLGGTVKGGTAGAMNLANGTTRYVTLNLRGGSITGAVNATATATVNLSGAPTVAGAGIIVAEGKKLTLGEMVKGASVAVMANGVFTESGKADYAQYFTAADEGYRIYTEDDGALSCVVRGYIMVSANGTQTVVKDPVAAWQTGSYDYIKLCEANNTIADLQGLSVYVDLNGCDLTVGGSGMLYAFDSANDTYDAAACGTLTNVGTVQIQQEVTGRNGNYYLAVTRNNTTTMHAVKAQITYVTLRTSAAGLYYKATYHCDEILEANVKRYGVVLSAFNMPARIL